MGVLFQDFPRKKCRIEVCWSKKTPKVFLKLNYDNEITQSFLKLENDNDNLKSPKVF
jgi:hypothetical protein